MSDVLAKSYVVLIVENSLVTRLVLKKSLIMGGLQLTEVIMANDGQEALTVLKNKKIDFVLSDLHMPNLDGRGLLTAMKTESLFPRLGVAMITAEQNKAIHDELLALGATCIIQKPFTPETFRAGYLQLLNKDVAS